MIYRFYFTDGSNAVTLLYQKNSVIAATTSGIWIGNVFYPPHSIIKVEGVNISVGKAL